MPVESGTMSSDSYRDKGVTHARTFTGATWFVDGLGEFDLADLPVSVVSFDDRLYVFGVKLDGSIWPLAFTVDGRSWATPETRPTGLNTAEPIATAAFRNRLYLFARDSASGALRATSSADLESWNAWVDVPSGGLAPTSAVAAAALGDTLHLFGLHDTNKPPRTNVVVHNSTVDGGNWTGWSIVENGARPERQPQTDQPLDVAATVFGNRVYIASRWESASTGGANLIRWTVIVDSCRLLIEAIYPGAVRQADPGEPSTLRPSTRHPSDLCVPRILSTALTSTVTFPAVQP